MRLLGVKLEAIGVKAEAGIDVEGGTGSALKSGAKRVLGAVARVTHNAAEKLADATDTEQGTTPSSQSCFDQE